MVQVVETAWFSVYHRPETGYQRCAAGSRVMTGDQTIRSQSRQTTDCPERQMPASITTRNSNYTVIQ